MGNWARVPGAIVDRGLAAQDSAAHGGGEQTEAARGARHLDSFLAMRRPRRQRRRPWRRPHAPRVWETIQRQTCPLCTPFVSSVPLRPWGQEARAVCVCVRELAGGLAFCSPLIKQKQGFDIIGWARGWETAAIQFSWRRFSPARARRRAPNPHRAEPVAIDSKQTPSTKTVRRIHPNEQSCYEAARTAHTHSMHSAHSTHSKSTGSSHSITRTARTVKSTASSHRITRKHAQHGTPASRPHNTHSFRASASHVAHGCQLSVAHGCQLSPGLPSPSAKHSWRGRTAYRRPVLSVLCSPCEGLGRAEGHQNI